MSAPEELTVIGLLGPVAVGPGTDPDDLRPVAGIRARRLLAVLALAGGRTCSADRLIDEVWGDNPPRSPMSALHTQVSRLRPLLAGAQLEAIGNGYRLTGCRTDLDVVAALADSADASGPDEALRWWRGRPGDDLGDEGDLADEVRRQSARVRDDLDRRRVRIALERSDFAGAREIASGLCRQDPLDEYAHIDLMHAFAGEGRVADALAVFARLRRALAEQLGTDPGDAATALNAELLAGPPHGNSSATTESIARHPRRGRIVGIGGETTDLIGRDDDIASIVALFDRERLVTLQGPGGVGKTRVARRVAEGMADLGRPVYFVALAPVRDADDLVVTLASALGVGEVEVATGGRPRLAVGDLADRLVDAVRGERAILILDNCEQVVERCAQVVADLLAAESTVQILTTSRSPLQLASEYIYQLPVLDVAPDGAAVALFERRARAIRPDARLPTDEVARLCRHLDGLPLAIELAAARIRTMSLAEITTRLDERFALLRGSDRSAPDRHRTLYAVIEWSWELLDDDARGALRSLCRFPAGFSAEAAGIILGYNGVRLDDVLESLVNQSLLSVVENGVRIRYRMLETVREFGEEQLRLGGPGDERDTMRAMRRWALGFAVDAEHRAEEAIDEEIFEHVSSEVENLVWVLRACVDATEGSEAVDSDVIPTLVSVFTVLASLWMVRGLHGEIMSWGRKLVRALPTPPSDLAEDLRRRWQFTVLAAAVHLVQQQDLRGLAIGRRQLRRLHRPTHTYTEPTDLLAACALSTNTLGALRLIWRATQASDDRVRSAALAIRLNVRENSGDLENALLDGQNLRATSVAQRDSWMSSMADASVGGIFGQQGEWEAAVDLYRQGIVSLRRLGAVDDEVQTGAHLVAALVGLGRMREAQAELAILTDGWSPEDPDPRGNPEILAAMMLAHGEVDLAAGNDDRARELFWRAAHILDVEHPLGPDDPGMVMLVAVSAIGMMRTGETARARQFIPLIAEGVDKSFSPVGWHDIPLAGVAALAIGYIVSVAEPDAVDGPRLMALSRRLRARRDFPTSQHVYDNMQTLSGLAVAEWDSLLAETATRTRRQAADEVRTILAPRLPKDRRSIRLDQVLRM